MKIREEVIKRTILELDQVDLNFLTYSLNYAYHRAKKHKTPMTAWLPTIQIWREKMGIVPVKIP